jgi:hypothetical protein
MQPANQEISHQVEAGGFPSMQDANKRGRGLSIHAGCKSINELTNSHIQLSLFRTILNYM